MYSEFRIRRNYRKPCGRTVKLPAAMTHMSYRNTPLAYSEVYILQSVSYWSVIDICNIYYDCAQIHFIFAIIIFLEKIF